MKQLLAYIIPLVVAAITTLLAATPFGIETSVSAADELASYGFTTCCVEAADDKFDWSALPAVLSVNVAGTQIASSRNQNASRFYIDLNKDKGFAAYKLPGRCQKELWILHSLFTEPIQRLINFGVLII